MKRNNNHSEDKHETCAHDIETNEKGPANISCSSPSKCSALLERKRKERHQSSSESQEKKLTRSLSQEEIQPNPDMEPKLEKCDSDKHTCKAIKTDEKVQNSKSMPKKSVENNQNVKESCQLLKLTPLLESVTRELELFPEAYEYQQQQHRNKFTMVKDLAEFMNEAEKQRNFERFAPHVSNNNNTTRKLKRNLGGKKKKAEREIQESINEFDEDSNDPELALLVEDEDFSPRSSSFSSSASGSLDDGDGDEILSAMEENNTKPTSLDLDFTTLHHHMESHEPILHRSTLRASNFEDQVMLSPRNSIIHVKESHHLDVAPSPPLYQPILDPMSRQDFSANPKNMKINTLTKQISNLKKQLRLLEEEHDQIFGYKPSHGDKLKQKDMRRCILLLGKAKKELKILVEDPLSTEIKSAADNLLSLSREHNIQSIESDEDRLKRLEETVNIIEKTLAEKRKADKRPDDASEMSHSEILVEKSMMQKQLLMLESKFGRPRTKKEKELVRDLYEKYRFLKQNSSASLLKERKKSGGSIIKENSLDLVTIIEHETLDLSTEEKPSSSSGSGPNDSADYSIFPIPSSSQNEDNNNEDCVENEGFNVMNLYELEFKLRSVREEKKVCRNSLRKYEMDFLNTKGRLPQKEEKYGTTEMEIIYQKYKRLRATVRLLDVLIGKQKQQRNSIGASVEDLVSSSSI